jgi:hypothetical protein
MGVVDGGSVSEQHTIVNQLEQNLIVETWGIVLDDYLDETNDFHLSIRQIASSLVSYFNSTFSRTAFLSTCDKRLHRKEAIQSIVAHCWRETVSVARLQKLQDLWRDILSIDSSHSFLLAEVIQSLLFHFQFSSSSTLSLASMNHYERQRFTENNRRKLDGLVVALSLYEDLIVVCLSHPTTPSTFESWSVIDEAIAEDIRYCVDVTRSLLSFRVFLSIKLIELNFFLRGPNQNILKTFQQLCLTTARLGHNSGQQSISLPIPGAEFDFSAKDKHNYFSSRSANGRKQYTSSKRHQDGGFWNEIVMGQFVESVDNNRSFRLVNSSKSEAPYSHSQRLISAFIEWNDAQYSSCGNLYFICLDRMYALKVPNQSIVAHPPSPSASVGTRLWKSVWDFSLDWITSSIKLLHSKRFSSLRFQSFRDILSMMTDNQLLLSMFANRSLVKPCSSKSTILLLSKLVFDWQVTKQILLVSMIAEQSACVSIGMLMEDQLVQLRDSVLSLNEYHEWFCRETALQIAFKLQLITMIVAHGTPLLIPTQILSRLVYLYLDILAHCLVLAANIFVANIDSINDELPKETGDNLLEKQFIEFISNTVMYVVFHRRWLCLDNEILLQSLTAILKSNSNTNLILRLVSFPMAIILYTFIVPSFDHSPVIHYELLPTLDSKAVGWFEIISTDEVVYSFFPSAFDPSTNIPTASQRLNFQKAYLLCFEQWPQTVLIRSNSLADCPNIHTLRAVDVSGLLQTWKEATAIASCDSPCSLTSSNSKIKMLPTEVLVIILSFSQCKRIGRMATVCHQFAVAVGNNHLWKNLFHRYFTRFIFAESILSKEQLEIAEIKQQDQRRRHDKIVKVINDYTYGPVECFSCYYSQRKQSNAKDVCLRSNSIHDYRQLFKVICI